MRIAFLPIENGFWLNTTTILSSYISYLETIFPDDLIYPISDLDFLIKTNPELVFIYQTETFLFDKVVEISAQIKKELGVPVILLGNHITYMPKTLPESIDIGILGEGEQQLEKIISLFKKGKPDERSLSKIANIVFNSKKQNIIIGKPSFTQDINSIALTRKTFYKMPGNWRFSISTGRGNPHKNIYSQNTEFPVRLNSIDFIIKDIVDIVTYFPEIKKVPILDNVFLHDFTRFKTFCETAKEGDLTKYLKLEVFARDYELNDEILNLLRYYLKVYRLNIILTPISENIQKENKYPNVKKEKLISILDLCYKLNINTKIHNSLFYSNENIEDSSKSYWFINNITKKYNYFFDIENKIIIPKVGTESWIKAINKKIINEKNYKFNLFDNTLANERLPLLSNITKENIVPIFTNFNNLKEKYFIKEPLLNLIQEKIDEGKSTYSEVEERVLDYIDKRDTLEVENKKDIFNLVSKDTKYQISNEILSLLNKLDGTSLIPKECKMTREVIKGRLDNAKTISYEQNFQNYEQFISESIFDTLIENIANNKNLKEEIFTDLVKETTLRYYYSNQAFDTDNLLFDKSFMSINSVNIIEQILKTNDIKSILQITNTNIMDLNKVFSDYYNIKTIDNDFFNNPVIEIDNKAQKYDCIVLFFTLDIVPKISRVMSYCNRMLNEHGSLLITFINPKNVFFVNRFICNFDLNEMFFGFKRSNYITIENMEEILERYNFIPKNIKSFTFPDYPKTTRNQKIIIDTLKKYFPNDISEYTNFSYTYVCRKKIKTKTY